MKRLISCLLLCFTLNSLNAQISAPLKKPTNILFILVDDLGWSDLGCYGSSGYETPNVDILASQGMKFTDFYSSGPVCSPTRASILTGKNTARTRINTYLIYPARIRMVFKVIYHWMRLL